MLSMKAKLSLNLSDTDITNGPIAIKWAIYIFHFLFVLSFLFLQYFVVFWPNNEYLSFGQPPFSFNMSDTNFTCPGQSDSQ